MKSPHGRRVAICAHTGFSWDFIHHGIAWSILQRGMVDQPSYDPDDNNDDKVELKNENAEQIANYINSIKI